MSTAQKGIKNAAYQKHSILSAESIIVASQCKWEQIRAFEIDYTLIRDYLNNGQVKSLTDDPHSVIRRLRKTFGVVIKNLHHHVQLPRGLAIHDGVWHARSVVAQAVIRPVLLINKVLHPSDESVKRAQAILVDVTGTRLDTSERNDTIVENPPNGRDQSGVLA